MVAGRSSLVAGSTKTPPGYRDLDVYNRSLDALVRLHQVVAGFPDSERFELTTQLRRASKSIPANIAEEYAKRRSPKEFVSFLTNALGSANEIEVHAEVAFRLGYISQEVFEELTSDFGVIGRQLSALIATWKRQVRAP